jgi:hypothetical protein
MAAQLVASRVVLSSKELLLLLVVLVLVLPWHSRHRRPNL